MPNIKIYPVRDSHDPSKAIYLIDIPQGDNPPYQAQNKKYYRRLNATKYELPHSEVADFFYKRRKPKLFLNCLVINPGSFSNNELKRAADSGAKGVVKRRASYRLRLILTNLGLAAAKYAQVIVDFKDIDIERVISGPSGRIDHLRNGIPTLQWDNPYGIIYAHSHVGTVIWELQVKLHKNMVGTVSWEAQAEEMDFQEGKYILDGFELSSQGNEIKPYYLLRYEDHPWGKSKDSQVESEST